MNKLILKVIVLGLSLGVISPGGAAPTDRSVSGTMDISNDRNDTHADWNVNKPPVPPTANTIAPDPIHQGPKVVPANPNSPKVDDPSGNLDTMKPAVITTPSQMTYPYPSMQPR